jgi:RsmE family RNA methyltransferase
MNVVLLEPHERDGPLGGDRARHVRDVLGLGVGGCFRVGIVDGPLGRAEITAIDGDVLSLACTWDDTIPERPRIDLILALPRPKVLARLLSPIAQLGVARLILTGAWKVERFYFDAHILDPREHLPKLIEGLAQAKDTRLPIVSVHRSLAFLLDEELEGLGLGARRIVVDPSASTTLESALAVRSTERVVLAIGPEGGFTARELDRLAARAFVAASLGPRVLRSDVAAITALARAHALLAG